MVLGNMMFWFFLAATVVASLTFVAVIVWAENRRKDREEYYRFELRKRMVDSGNMSAAAYASLMRYEHDLRQQQGRQKLLIAAFIIAGLGLGTCVGLMFLEGAVWMVGLIPLFMGLAMLLFGFFVAPKPDPEPPAALAELGEKD